MTILAAVVRPDRVLLAADGRSLNSDPSFNPDLYSTQLNRKLVEVPEHEKLMVGITGPHGNLFDFRDALVRHRLTTWREIIDVGREELISMNNASQDRALRAHIAEPALDQFLSTAIVAGIVDGRPGAVKFGYDGRAIPVEYGPCFVGGVAFLMPALVAFAERIAGFVVTSSAQLETFLEAAEGVYPDILLPIDTWELSL